MKMYKYFNNFVIQTISGLLQLNSRQLNEHCISRAFIRSNKYNVTSHERFRWLAANKSRSHFEHPVVTEVTVIVACADTKYTLGLYDGHVIVLAGVKLTEFKFRKWKKFDDFHFNLTRKDIPSLY